jgi:hypothetical protein
MNYRIRKVPRKINEANKHQISEEFRILCTQNLLIFTGYVVLLEERNIKTFDRLGM